MTRAPLTMALRLRAASTGSAAFGLVAVLVIVGALFPAVGHTFGKLNLPRGVSELLGGADYATITGWFRSEIGSVYGPLLMGAVAITAAASITAGEEEDRILALVLAHPITRARLVLAKAGAIAILVVIVAAATWAGLLAGVAIGGGGINVGHITAFAAHLAFFGLTIGAVALAVGAATGRRTLTTGVASGVGIVGWLINGFAPLVGGIAWLKYLSPFYYYAGHDPLTRGIDVIDLVVLGGVALILTALGMEAFERRDLRA
ncbi:MAG TPA: ABC transporter permease subunit [Solirubrobacteraceae bacterium]|nr:ABC transporter permease subunit [Solirubrobacteraceae bacterium]